MFECRVSWAALWNASISEKPTTQSSPTPHSAALTAATVCARVLVPTAARGLSGMVVGEFFVMA